MRLRSLHRAFPSLHPSVVVRLHCISPIPYSPIPYLPIPCWPIPYSPIPSLPIPYSPIPFGLFRVGLFLDVSVFAYSVFAYSVFAYYVFAYSVFAYSVFAYSVFVTRITSNEYQIPNEYRISNIKCYKSFHTKILHPKINSFTYIMLKRMAAPIKGNS